MNLNIFRIQKKMQETFGTGTPKDQDVVVLYKGEQTQVQNRTKLIRFFNVLVGSTKLTGCA